ncbi:MAG: hypothetical protein LC116_05560 [Bacteroidetes bacterium]|nr:hypothetical protein [Bacteroidota bacterium]
MTPNNDAPAEGTNNSGRNNLSGGTPQKYEITPTGRVTIRVEGAEHHFDLKRVFEYIHTTDGTLTFRAVGTPQRRFTGKLATDLHAALRQWYGTEERTAGNALHP